MLVEGELAERLAARRVPAINPLPRRAAFTLELRQEAAAVDLPRSRGRNACRLTDRRQKIGAINQVIPYLAAGDLARPTGDQRNVHPRLGRRAFAADDDLVSHHRARSRAGTVVADEQ